MIKDEEKYFTFGGDILAYGGPSTWHITDWDQRRVISVTMDGEQHDPDLVIEHLRRHSRQVAPGIYRIHVSQSGEIVSMHSDPKDDRTYCVHYPHLQEALLPEGTQTVRRDGLEELERLGKNVDLVVYPPCSETDGKKAVFKYYFHGELAEISWTELNLWIRLPRHPNIVPFDRVVVGELEGRVIGFTTDYIPGGTIAQNGSRVFQLEWLRQLLELVDDLNLDYRIAHQDIAPQNLLVNEQTNRIMLFDFNCAARVDHPFSRGEAYDERQNDVKGTIITMYEVITRDDSLRCVPDAEKDSKILSQEWVQHPEVKLNHPVASYKALLREWQDKRATGLRLDNSVREPKAIHWPSRPEPPLIPSSILKAWSERRQHVLARGDQVLNWERPPQEQLDSKTCMLSTGKPFTCHTRYRLL